MRVTYIYPDMFERERSVDAMQPLAIAALAAHTPPEWERRFFDERLETIDFDEDTDLVVLTLQTFTAKRGYRIAARYRAKGIPVVVGGFHATLLPEEAEGYVDTVVTGDAENVWSEVLADAAAGRLKGRYDGGICDDPARIRFDRSLFTSKRYAPMIPVQLSRGCRFSCDFCSIHSFYGSALLSRPTQSVRDELAALPYRFLLFTDDNLLVDEHFLRPLLAELTPLKKHWSCQISIDAAFRPELLIELRRAGCIAVFVGFESMETGNLTSMGKGENLKVSDYSEAVNRFREAGLMVAGSFVFGYDDDTEESIRRALEFALQNRLALCHFNPLYPYPRTRVYERLHAEGRLLYERWWLDDAYRYGEPLFRPKQINPRRLSELIFQARMKFNSAATILKRGLDFRSNARSPLRIAAFLTANLVSRREIYAKQGGRLG